MCPTSSRRSRVIRLVLAREGLITNGACFLNGSLSTVLILYSGFLLTVLIVNGMWGSWRRRTRTLSGRRKLARVQVCGLTLLWTDDTLVKKRRSHLIVCVLALDGSPSSSSGKKR